MEKVLLIDAAHAEETRVVLLDSSGRVEDFDCEAVTKKQINSNIYLAKVTRVEPALQAAFVEYGGNKQGFLSFSEIHPDYYQIPREDRQRLLDLEANTHRDFDLDDDDGIRTPVITNARRPRPYKIQEVIRKRQILLVQVIKEERGNKGAALTTYLSLAGRYSVLMPNTAKGSGISRKITSATDRKRLKKITSDLDVPSGMGLIVRTAGSNRTKAEIKRDFEYLLRLWDSIREITLQSIAPCLVYEEGNLIKRAIRDIYSKEVTSVLVQGDGAYREAKDFMKMLTPSYARHVHHYKEPIPLFTQYSIENQLDSLLSPVVSLRSGGSIVIGQTEALVAIDVNSGRAIREYSIEETAIKTNLEAADEVARQIRLRDLGGLIVIDFIDMDDVRNNRAVEKRIKDALKIDRARVQVGRISSFGLLEMSRQRLRPSMMEMNTQICTHCEGSGHIRSLESFSLHILRHVTQETLNKNYESIRLVVPLDVATYLLNKKRDTIQQIELQSGSSLYIHPEPDLYIPQFRVEVHSKSLYEDTDFEGGDHSFSRPLRIHESQQPIMPVLQAEPPQEEAELSSDNFEGEDYANSRKRRRLRKRKRGQEDSFAENTLSVMPEQSAQEQHSPLEEGSKQQPVSAEDKNSLHRQRDRKRGRTRWDSSSVKSSSFSHRKAEPRRIHSLDGSSWEVVIESRDSLAEWSQLEKSIGVLEDTSLVPEREVLSESIMTTSVPVPVEENVHLERKSIARGLKESHLALNGEETIAQAAISQIPSIDSEAFTDMNDSFENSGLARNPRQRISKRRLKAKQGHPVISDEDASFRSVELSHSLEGPVLRSEGEGSVEIPLLSMNPSQGLETPSVSSNIRSGWWKRRFGV